MGALSVGVDECHFIGFEIKRAVILSNSIIFLLRAHEGEFYQSFYYLILILAVDLTLNMHIM